MNADITLLTATVTANNEIAPGFFRMTLAAAPEFASPAPGQFVMVREAGSRDPLLARPLSIHGFSRQRAEAVVTLIFRIVGRGTTKLARVRMGDALQLLGPLGRPFAIDAARKTHILVAGGIGVAPLAFLARHLRQLIPPGEGTVVSYCGASRADSLVGLEDLEEVCSRTAICTDDGSRGTRGPVTDLLAADLDSYDPRDTALYACGPFPMMERLGEILYTRTFPCQVALEERMACGVGACLGCTVAVTEDGGAGRYMRVCRDGPVFELPTVLRRRKDEQWGGETGGAIR